MVHVHNVSTLDFRLWESAREYEGRLWDGGERLLFATPD